MVLLIEALVALLVVVRVAERNSAPNCGATQLLPKQARAAPIASAAVAFYASMTLPTACAEKSSQTPPRVQMHSHKTGHIVHKPGMKRRAVACGCFLLVIRDSRGPVNERRRLHFFCIGICGLWVGGYPHEEEEEERQQHDDNDDVENRLRERGDRLDVHDAKERWAENLVPAKRFNQTFTSAFFSQARIVCGERGENRTRWSGSRLSRRTTAPPRMPLRHGACKAPARDSVPWANNP